MLSRHKSWIASSLQTEAFYLTENAPVLVFAGCPKSFVHDAKLFLFPLLAPSREHIL